MSPEFDKYHYSAFGMDIHSEFKLTLPPANATTPKDWPVEILHASVTIPSSLPYSFNNNEGIKYGRADDGILINIETIARMAIRGNTTILCDPYPGSSEKMLSICIVGIALVILLKQRKLFLLHGSAVTGMHGTFAFIGNRGAGKSTTAAALAHHGYKVLCDDIIPIVPGPLIMPGVPFVNLLPDAYERLIGNPDDAQGSFNGVDKFSVQLPASTHQEPLTAIFILEKQQNTTLEIQQIKGAAKIQALFNNAIMYEDIDDPVQQFSLFTEQLSGVATYQIRRPESGHSLDEVVTEILKICQHFAQA